MFVTMKSERKSSKAPLKMKNKFDSRENLRKEVELWQRKQEQREI